MKAFVSRAYGSPDILRLEEVEKPSLGDSDVLIKNRAVSVNALDWRLLEAKPFLVRLMGGGLLKPKIHVLGVDVAGQIEAVGKNVTQFKPGDAVFGDTSGAGCGGFAEYVRTRENVIAKIPGGMSFEEAAAIPLAGVTALQALRDSGGLRAKETVVINGASGGVGTFAVQIARVLGAEVTAVCSSRNVEMVAELGADHVVDYTQEDFTTNGRQYDLIFGVNGYHPLSAYKRALKQNGRFIMAGGTTKQIVQTMMLGSLYSKKGGRRMAMMMAKPNQDDLTFLAKLFEDGRLKPVIEKQYPFAETPEAIRHVERGHARGKVVVTF